MNLSSLLFVNKYSINSIKTAFSPFLNINRHISSRNSNLNRDLFKKYQTKEFLNILKCQTKLISYQQNSKEKEGGKNETNDFRNYFSFSFIPILFAKDSNDDDEDDGIKKNSRRKTYNFIADVVEEVLPSLVQIEIKPQNHYYNIGVQPGSSGSGFIVSSDGLILTNAHVIRDPSQEIIVKLNDQRNFKARVLKMDRLTDLAVLKIDCKNLKAAKLGDSDGVKTGEFVIALGSPLTLTSSVTSGIVSNPFRDGIELGLNNEVVYIQTDAMITHGNSGGPLVNLDGEVIGINSMKVTEGISFSIPSKYAINLLEPSTKANQKKYKYMGIKIITLTLPLYRMLKMQSNFDVKIPKNFVQGCLVIEVEPNSPSERAGLHRGDIIISANNIAINNNRDLFKILRKTLDLNLTILRDDIQIELNLIAEEK